MRGRRSRRRWLWRRAQSPVRGPEALVFLVLAVALTLADALAAQEPRVGTTLDKTLLGVGDRLELAVRVEHASGETVLWPDSLSLAPFELLGVELLPPEDVEGGVVSGARFTLTVFELGDLELPGFELGVEDSDGSSVPLFTDPYGVTVESVGLDEGGDIRAIRGPLGMPISVIHLLPWLLLLLAAACVAYWLWRRRRRDEGEDVPRRSAILPRLPHEEAYEALDRLEASNLLERGEIKEYHIVVSEIIRTYVEGRFDVYALEMTTGEVIEGLGDRGLEGGTLGAFHDFLGACDLVKFAKLRPTPAGCRQVLARARELVDRTRPVFEDFATEPSESEGGAGEGGREESGFGDGDGPPPAGPAKPGGSGEAALEPAGAEGG